MPAPIRNSQSGAACPRGELSHEARFSDAGVAGDEASARRARDHFLEATLQPLEFGLAGDEWGGLTDMA
jgi:hypothetical protein